MEPAPAKVNTKTTKKSAVDYSKKYWWVGVIAMPLVFFVLARIWPESESKALPANFTSVTNFVTIQQEFVSLKQQPLDDPNLQQLIQRALDLTAKGDYRGSIPLYEQAVKQAPVPALYNNLGAAYASINDTRAARENLQQALAKNPAYELAQHNLEAINPTSAYFSDQFAGKSLASEWALMNPDPQKFTMQPEQKSLLIVTQKGVLSDSKNLKNWLVLNKELPSGDYEIVVKASLQIQGAGNEVAITLFADDKNYLSLAYIGDWELAHIHRTPHFTHTSQGATAADFTGNQRLDAASEPECIFLKIDRNGNQYTGSYAFAQNPADNNPAQWTKIGTVPWINFHGKLVLSASNVADNGPGVAAEFHSVTIRKQ